MQNSYENAMSVLTIKHFLKLKIPYIDYIYVLKLINDYCIIEVIHLFFEMNSTCIMYRLCTADLINVFTFVQS